MIPDFRKIFAQTRTVAVLGAHRERSRPAFYVPDYLHQAGFRILPVNPGLVGETLWGERVVAQLTDLEEPADLVDVFRRSELLPTHLSEILGMRPLPKVVWLQSGIFNSEFAKELEKAGVEVVQDRCALVEHQRFR